jgi:alanine dehydrogenase
MLIGVPKEIKNKEFRVGMTPTRCVKWLRPATR